MPAENIQRDFIDLMEQLNKCACHSGKEILLFLDPMHQIHNNENGYAWQPVGLKGTRQALANTGRRRLNIIGAINPVTFEPTVLLTEENCCAEVIEAFLARGKETISGG